MVLGYKNHLSKRIKKGLGKKAKRKTDDRKTIQVIFDCLVYFEDLQQTCVCIDSLRCRVTIDSCEPFVETLSLNRVSIEASVSPGCFRSKTGNSKQKLRFCLSLRKEVIQPHLPVRLPCYDFTLLTKRTFGTALPCGLD